MAGLSNPVTLTASDLVSANVNAGLYIHINCTVAGNVSLTVPNGTVIVAVAVGSSFFPLAVNRVNSTSTTATATYQNLYR